MAGAGALPWVHLHCAVCVHAVHKGALCLPVPEQPRDGLRGARTGTSLVRCKAGTRATVLPRRPALPGNPSHPACRLYTGFHGSSTTAMRRHDTRLMPCVPALLSRNTCGSGSRRGRHERAARAASPPAQCPRAAPRLEDPRFKVPDVPSALVIRDRAVNLAASHQLAACGSQVNTCCCVDGKPCRHVACMQREAALTWRAQRDARDEALDLPKILEAAARKQQADG